MPMTKEEIRLKKKEFNQSPAGKKSSRLSDWKRSGIIDPDLSAVYDYYIELENCMICKKKFKNSLDRHLDHDHSINDDDNIRYICCCKCNGHLLRGGGYMKTKNIKNTSGHLNVSYSKDLDKWIFRKTINQKVFCKYFDTKEETIQFKIEFESQK